MATKLSEKKKVLVGMSGGIDSSAVCMLLQDPRIRGFGNNTANGWIFLLIFPLPDKKNLTMY